MKTVKLLRDRGGDKKGGRITVPDEVAAELVASGTATADIGEPVPVKAAPVVAPTVPKLAYDALKADHDANKAVVKELEAENAELLADNKKLAEEVKALKDELAKKTAAEKKP